MNIKNKIFIDFFLNFFISFCIYFFIKDIRLAILFFIISFFYNFFMDYRILSFSEIISYLFLEKFLILSFLYLLIIFFNFKISYILILFFFFYFIISAFFKNYFPTFIKIKIKDENLKSFNDLENGVFILKDEKDLKEIFNFQWDKNTESILRQFSGKEKKIRIYTPFEMIKKSNLNFIKCNKKIFISFEYSLDFFSSILLNNLIIDHPNKYPINYEIDLNKKEIYKKYPILPRPINFYFFIPYLLIIVSFVILNNYIFMKGNYLLFIFYIGYYYIFKFFYRNYRISLVNDKNMIKKIIYVIENNKLIKKDNIKYIINQSFMSYIKIK